MWHPAGMSAKQPAKLPRLKPISLAHLTPEEAIKMAFKGKPLKLKDLLPEKKEK